MKKWMMLFLSLSLSTSVMAQQSKQAQVEELLQAMQADAIVDTMYAQFDQMFAGMGQQMGIKPSEQAAFDGYMKKVLDSIREEMSWDSMKGQMIDIYAKHYTEKEIADMLAFYNSETGKSMVAKMPLVMQDSMQMSQQMMQTMMPKIQAMAAEMQQEVAKLRAGQ